MRRVAVAAARIAVDVGMSGWPDQFCFGGDVQAGEGPHEEWPAMMRRGDDLRTGRIHIDKDPVIPAATENFDAHLTWKRACRPNPPGLSCVLPFSLRQANPAIWVVYRGYPGGPGLDGRRRQRLTGIQV